MQHIPTVEIPYRLDKDGKGALYDHFTTQRAGVRSVFSYDQSYADIATIRKNLTLQTSAQTTILLKYGTPVNNLHIIPDLCVPENFDDEGLLIIPGKHAGAGNKDYDAFTRSKIKHAMLRGRPILAECGGLWDLAAAINTPIKKVKGHSERGMMRLGAHGDITYNTQRHNISVIDDTLLYGLLCPNDGASPPVFPVNSVHTMAVDETRLSPAFMVSARASGKIRDGQQDSELGTVEAIESKFGAPILGVQWHPEAYNLKHETSDPGRKQDADRYYASLQRRILTEMCKAVITSKETCSENYWQHQELEAFSPFCDEMKKNHYVSWMKLRRAGTRTVIRDSVTNLILKKLCLRPVNPMRPIVDSNMPFFVLDKFEFSRM